MAPVNGRGVDASRRLFGQAPNEPYRRFGARLAACRVGARFRRSRPRRSRTRRSRRSTSRRRSSSFKRAARHRRDAGTTLHGARRAVRSGAAGGLRRASCWRTRRGSAIVNLVPDPRAHPHSSLGYMMAACWRALRRRRDGLIICATTGSTSTACARRYRGGRARRARRCASPGTAFAFVALLDALGGWRRSAVRGGLAGDGDWGIQRARARVVARRTVCRACAGLFAIDEAAIVAEYGMTELTSQYYDARPRRGRRRCA